jgi:hypothetical protein
MAGRNLMPQSDAGVWILGALVLLGGSALVVIIGMGVRRLIEWLRVRRGERGRP